MDTQEKLPFPDFVLGALESQVLLTLWQIGFDSGQQETSLLRQKPYLPDYDNGTEKIRFMISKLSTSLRILGSHCVCWAISPTIPQVRLKYQGTQHGLTSRSYEVEIWVLLRSIYKPSSLHHVTLNLVWISPWTQETNVENDFRT